MSAARRGFRRSLLPEESCAKRTGFESRALTGGRKGSGEKTPKHALLSPVKLSWFRLHRVGGVREGKRRGSGLVEAALALLILGLLVWLGVEIVKSIGQRRRSDAFITDLRAFAEVFDRHVGHSKSVPSPAGSPVALPPALEAALKETNWHRGSPFGGNYEWIPPPVPPPAPATLPSPAAAVLTPLTTGAATVPPVADPDRPTPQDPQPARLRSAGRIAVTAFAPSFPLTATRVDLLHVDTAIDDGNLSTGRFRTGFNGWPVYTLGEP